MYLISEMNLVQMCTGWIVGNDNEKAQLNIVKLRDCFFFFFNSILCKIKDL